MLASVSVVLWMRAAPALGLTIAGLGIVFLAENARIPVDDPTTHLELTMIHEVMVLDHSGPDFAMIQYAATLKMWLLGAVIVAIAVPWHSGSTVLDGGFAIAGMLASGSSDRAHRIFDGASAAASHHPTADRRDRVVRSSAGAGRKMKR